MYTGDIKASFGKNIKMFRREKHWSQEYLSEQIDISVKHLSAIERGASFVSAELLEKLSVSLEIPVYCFFFDAKVYCFDEFFLKSMDRILENHLIKALDAIKTDLRQNVHKKIANKDL
jgi:transcriptional regulator with XRE-family HTH domain